MIELLIMVVYAVIIYTSSFLFLILVESDTVRSEVEYPDSWPSLTVAIPAYNEEDTLSTTLDSIIDAEYPEDRLEIIVVNDGSSDRTREIAEKYEERGDITLINQENQGKGAALNTALEESGTELFACVDADSRLREKSLKNVVSRMDDDTSAVASAMKVESPENLLQKVQMVEYVVNVFSRKLFQKINSIHVTPGPLSIYRREDIEDIGGFDPDSRVEDQEICFRLQKEHRKLKHARDGEVYTVAPDNFADYYRQRRRWYAGTFETLIKHREMLLNRDYGDFGMFIMPSKVVHPMVSIFGLFLITYTLLNPVLSFLMDVMVLGSEAFNVGFNLTVAGVSSMVKWQLLSIDYTLLTALASLALFSTSMVYMAAIHVEESVRDIGILAAIVYVFWFFLIVGFMSLVSIIIVARKQLGGRGIEW
ncbi:MAG: glycosyltransferase family 2 protein [Candidatus Nanohaloarchaea archaeon]